MSKNEQLRERYWAVKRSQHWRTWPVIRTLRALAFRRLAPLPKRQAGGLSIIRYYWADFLEQHQADMRGHGLEIEETTTLRQYGGEALTGADALDLSAHNPDVRVVADLSRGDEIPGDRYDCFLIPFSTAVIYDIESALYHAVRLLKPGGVLLVNFWCIDFYLHRGLDMGTGGSLYMHHWLTPIGVHDLLHRLALTEDDYQVQVYGNLLARLAFLLNLPAHELTAHERDYVDPGQPLLICVRVVKPFGWQAVRPVERTLHWTPQTRPAAWGAETQQFADAYQRTS
jgi:SAM-dependent methyltransferase